jgi:aerobic carbon-monoxide dehydrogenase medium subunit
MYTFTYEAPSSVDAAAALAAAGSKPMAGGQTLLPSMKLRLSQPGQVVDLGGIAALKGIKRDGHAIVIGAMTCHADVAASAEVRAAIPALAGLASHIGDKQVRARGTVGGSLANNDPAACYPSAVLALGATVHTNKRTIKADEFFTGMYSTALG